MTLYNFKDLRVLNYMARKYQKKSLYWEQRKKSDQETVANNIVSKQKTVDMVASFSEDSHYMAVAACGGGATAPTEYRTNFAPAINPANYANIRAGVVPFNGGRDGYYSVGDAIQLVYLAYFNVAVIRNSINLLQDFSVSKLQIKTTNLTVKRFFENWFDAISLNDFMSQFFLEYYRSGNVFIYKFNGKIKNTQFNMLKTALGAKSDELPVRYIILNPMQVYLQVGPTYNYNFVRMLSTYELARLRDPKTEEDKAVLKSFPPAIRDQITQYSSLQYIYAPLDTERLYYVFNRKQDYEPLAIPPVYPVLNDVELKLQMKRMDFALVNMMEQVVLLVTTGERADEYNSGSNPKNLANLQRIFSNQTVARVLLADYTTKLEWKVPDLKELLGQEKYNRVDLDIKEGLQYMFFGDEKFANASIKAKILIQGLKEGRRVFLDNFLRPEIKKICQKMNFKTLPDVEFEEINIEDPSSINRIYYQMASLGLLTPDELNEAIETGVLPDKDQAILDQQEYKKQRDKGLFQPLLGKPQDGAGGRPDGTGSPKSSKKVSPIGTTKASISMKEIVGNIAEMNKLESSVGKAYQKKYNLDSLNDSQQIVVTSVAKSIILNEPQEQWTKSVPSYIKEPKNIPSDVLEDISEISAEYDVDGWEAIILYRSRIND